MNVLKREGQRHEIASRRIFEGRVLFWMALACAVSDA